MAVAASDERTPLLHGGRNDASVDPESDAVKKNPDNPVNLSKSKVYTILAANWVSTLSDLGVYQALVI